MKRRTLVFVALGLLVWASIASLLGAYYYYSYNNLLQATSRPIINVNLGFDYGNGTIQWFNNTAARGGDTALNITTSVARVNYTEYSTGAFVNSINKVENASDSWFWWTWSKQYGFTLGPVACDKYLPSNNETLYWCFETSTYPPATPS